MIANAYAPETLTRRECTYVFRYSLTHHCSRSNVLASVF